MPHLGLAAKNFNPRSLAGATEQSSSISQLRQISIHAPSRERLPADNSCGWSCGNFNPRSLAGATARNDVFRRICRFQSTLPRGSDAKNDATNENLIISIHAPSRERLSASSSAFGLSNFNPRSLAGATLARVTAFRPARNFNPRSLAGATERNAAKDPGMAISIHAPSRERPFSLAKLHTATIFQSTLPRGSDTITSGARCPAHNISIHAPSRERLLLAILCRVKSKFQSTLPRGSDRQDCYYRLRSAGNFNPRSLAGATLTSMTTINGKNIFQSTLPRGSDI